MSDAESWVDSLEPVSCDEKCISKEQKTLATLVQQIDVHKPEVDTMNDSAHDLDDLCDDVHVVQAESKDANKRWEVLTANLTVRQQHLDSVSRLVEQLTNQLQPIEERLDEAEALVDAPFSNLTDADKGEQELRKIEALLSVLKEQEPEMSEVNDNLSLLMQQVDEKTPHATQVRAEVSQADQKRKDLIDKLNARKINLEEDVKHARVFQGSLADLQAWLPEAAERVSAQQPISTDPETVRKQLEEAQVLKDDITKHRALFQTAENADRS
ncbi:hypothetical protein OS493_001108 [Desmophyllum pertusum]|uniref:Uncharacterized protein n=1 Tax=Desmophyllum pertusum TaxID=174260 RepID=A0A9X0D5M5_9CNID|nr:hypothetical protein OS493_001108 [Desmophyllum pertusum]